MYVTIRIKRSDTIASWFRHACALSETALKRQKQHFWSNFIADYFGLLLQHRVWKQFWRFLPIQEDTVQTVLAWHNQSINWVLTPDRKLWWIEMRTVCVLGVWLEGKSMQKATLSWKQKLRKLLMQHTLMRNLYLPIRISFSCSLMRSGWDVS